VLGQVFGLPRDDAYSRRYKWDVFQALRRQDAQSGERTGQLGVMVP
jgi:hypothetical protein